MAQGSITPEQLQSLLNYASRRLNTTPEKLQQAFQQGGLAGLSGAMSAEEASRAEELVHNKEKAQQLLNSPEVQKLLDQLLNKG